MSVHVVTAAWVVAAYVILLKASATSGGSPRVAGVVGGDLVMSTVGQAAPAIRVLAALALAVLALLFWCGVTRALPALVGVALVVLLLPGVCEITEAVTLMGALVLGTTPLVLDNGLDHIAPQGDK